jgi:hypothetical protein
MTDNDNISQFKRPPLSNTERKRRHDAKRKAKRRAEAEAAAASLPPSSNGASVVPAAAATPPVTRFQPINCAALSGAVVLPSAPPAPPALPLPDSRVTVVKRPRNGGVTVAAFAASVALASVEVFFGVFGMTAIFPASPVPVMVMTATLEAAKLVTAAWLAQHWRVAPLMLRAPLMGVVVALMVLTGIGTYGYFTRAHLAHQVEAHEAIDNEASPVAEKIKIAESDLHDLDDRIRQFDSMVSDATARGRTRTAMALVDDQAKKRSDLVTERRKLAGKLADLRVRVSAVESRRAQVAAEIGPARFLADLLGWGDGEAAVKLITLLLVLVIDPAAILLMLAATYRRGAS